METIPEVQTPPPRRVPVAELGPAWIGIAAGIALAFVRAANGDEYDRAMLPAIGFGVLVASPAFLALMARRHRPGLYLASGLVYLPLGFMSIVTIPLLFVSAMAFVAYGRHADEEVPAVWAPLTAVILFVMTIAAFVVMLFNGGDDPRCSSTATSTSCTSDVITNGEALAGLGVTLLTLATARLLSRPRRSG
jgi:hypothetical protein